MFEKTRSDLVAELKALMDRFESLSNRANQHYEDADFAARTGLSDGSHAVMYLEMADKAIDQAAVCGEPITHLLVDRSLPLMFKRGVRRAERLASEWEGLLDLTEASARAGKDAFQERFGTAKVPHA